MFRTERLWSGIGLAALGGLLVFCVPAGAAEPASKPEQLVDLGRQALDQSYPDIAQAFFRKALELEPGNADAKRGLEKAEKIKLAAFQAPAAEDPAPPAANPPAANPPATAPAEGTPASVHRPQATIENQHHLEAVRRQQLIADIEERLQRARDLVHSGQPEAALTTLRLAQNLVRGDDQVSEQTRNDLDRRIQAQIISTARSEERIVAERAEAARLAAMSDQQARALNLSIRNQDTVTILMTQFGMLMAQGQYNVLYNGGLGNIAAATAPFSDARLLAQRAQALAPNALAPRAGVWVAETTGFLDQTLAFDEVKAYRSMLSLEDVARASVPFPDTQVIEYPDADLWRNLSERRIARYGRAVDLLDRDAKTKSILQKLEEPISMQFQNETPLEDVLKYIKNATQGPNDSGIPIYVDPVGLQEADKTLQNTVQLDLEGVPLKTTLRLLLKQLALTYTVKDGMLTITSESSNDQPTEIRVYPVADLAIIPFSLMGIGGGGGMGGGMMGGMGGGMGGMGGGMGGGMMGGMGGGMGGMGGGMGGMMSLPPTDPADSPASGYAEKKSS